MEDVEESFEDYILTISDTCRWNKNRVLSKQSTQGLRVGSCKFKIAEVKHFVERLEERLENYLSLGCHEE